MPKHTGGKDPVPCIGAGTSYMGSLDGNKPVGPAIRSEAVNMEVGEHGGVAKLGDAGDPEIAEQETLKEVADAASQEQCCPVQQPAEEQPGTSNGITGSVEEEWRQPASRLERGGDERA